MSADRAKPVKEKKSSGLGGVMMILIVLWLAGLTALFLVYMKTPKDGDLAERVAKLETGAGAGKVGGKINVSDGKQIAALEKKVMAMEKRLAGVPAGEIAAATADAGGTGVDAAGTGANGDKCDCKDMAGRLDKLEALVLAKRDVTPAERSVAAAPVTHEKPKVTPKRSARQAKRAAVRPKRVARATAVSRRSVTVPDTSRALYRETGGDVTYGRKTIYDMTHRWAPVQLYTSEEASKGRQFAPGSDVYGASSSAYLDSGYDYTGGGSTFTWPETRSSQYPNPSYSGLSYQTLHR